MAQIALKEEGELQARSRIIGNKFKETNNCIVLSIDTHLSNEKGISPFGFHFTMDQKRYLERKKQLRWESITKWLAWLAYYHHKFGIRHIFLVTLMAIFVLIGGWIFVRLESPNEIEDLKRTLVLMQGIIREMSSEAINVTITYAVNDHNLTLAEDRMGKLIKRYYKTMLEAEGRFHGSVWHKAENLELHLMWYYSSATFYAMTLFTTIGYGTITCQTFWGRFVSIVYASLGIPLMLVVLGDVGEWFQKILTKAYVFVYLRYKSLLNQKVKRELDEIYLPIWLALTIVSIYIMLCTLIIKMFDHNEGNKPGIDFGSALYFVFISLTTIGLGDVMPYNIQYSPFLCFAFLLGLALVSIVNTSIYAVMYETFFKQVRRVERGLERVHKQHHHGKGYNVFRDMEPAIKLLVLSFPHFDKERRYTILSSISGSFRKNTVDSHHTLGILSRRPTEASVSSEHAPIIKKKRAKVEFGGHMVRTRTESDLAAHDKEHDHDKVKRKSSFTAARRRAPTLGAMGGWELHRYNRHRTYTSDDSDASDKY